LDKEVQEFLDDPDVKDSLEQLEVAKQRLEAAVQVLSEVENENDPRIDKILVAEAKDLVPPDVPFVASTSVPIPTATTPQMAEVEAKQANTSLLSRMKLRMWRSFFAKANDYRKAHQNVCNRIQNAEQLFSAIGTSMDTGQIGAGAVVGAKAGSPGGFWGSVAGGVIGGTVVKIKISAKQYLLGKAISKGEDSFADLARQCAVGDEQKAEFETTARFMFSTAVLGASAPGMVKASFHVASKLKTTTLSSRTLGLKKDMLGQTLVVNSRII
jgi:hypothetical protein